MTHILAIDQGTTSSRAILFDANLKVRAVAQEEFAQHYPASGWVEHDPSDLWSTVAGTARAAIEKAGISARDIAAIGITNQRETTLIWDRATGEPIHRAIVWQGRRTADTCDALKAASIGSNDGLIADHDLRCDAPLRCDVAAEVGEVGGLPLGWVIRAGPADLQQVQQHVRHPPDLLNEHCDESGLPLGEAFAPALEQFGRAEH